MSSISSPKQDKEPIAALLVPSNSSSIYPGAFQGSVKGRSKQKLGDFFGLSNFGVNRTTLAPGSASALAHHHQLQDEFVYILQGVATLQLGDAEYEMKVGDCMGFPAGNGISHCIRNKSKIEPVVFLEIGDRTPGDKVDYPGVDLKVAEQDGKWKFTHKDGTPYRYDE